MAPSTSSGDTVSRVWRKITGELDVWNIRSSAAEPIIRLILDGTAGRVRLDKKSTSISLLVAMGVRQDGQKVLLAVNNMGGVLRQLSAHQGHLMRFAQKRGRLADAP